MRWLLWRQHRLQWFLAAGVLGSLAVLLAISGVRLSHALHAATDSCRAEGTCGLVTLPSAGIAQAIVNLTVGVPLLVGVFWGATAVGRELDTGTNRLVWTQTVSRRRWLRGKVSVLLVAAALVGAATSGMVTWWYSAKEAVQHERFDSLMFDTQGIVPVAYTLFAAALGLAAGVLWRRTLPAIATTVAVFLGARLLVENYLRPHFQAPLTLVSPLRRGGGAPTGAWTIRSDLAQNGHVITGAVRMPVACQAAVTREQADTCLNGLGFRFVTTYQPGSRYWTFQWIESAGFVALAGAFTAVAVIVTLRRDG